jgi:hypothetical protein
MRVKHVLRLVEFLVLNSFIGVAAVSASPFIVGSAGVAEACLGTFCSTVVVNAGLAQINNTFSGSGDTLTVSAAGNATFGVLNASASASYNVTGPATNAFAFGQAVFTDIITISFAPWDGLTGLLYVFYTLDGTVSSSGSGQAEAFVQLFVGPDTTQAQYRFQTYTSSTAGVFSVGAPLQFVYGQPFGFNFSLETCAGHGFLHPCSGLATGNGSGSADFFNTLILSGLIPTDLNGNPATGATFSSESGTQYSVNGVAAAPEPTSVVLLATGLLGLAIAPRRVAV